MMRLRKHLVMNRPTDFTDSPDLYGQMLLHKETTDVILGAYFKIYNELGYGFLEKVYENDMFIELSNQNLYVQKQAPIEVYYSQTRVGECYADLIVSEKVIVELKAAEGLREEHEAQLLNYLKATEMEIGLLLNFGVKPQFKRVARFNKKDPS